MPARSRRHFPSATFSGALLGILGSMVTTPPVPGTPTAEGWIVWLLLWTGSGLIVGAIFEALTARSTRRRNA